MLVVTLSTQDNVKLLQQLKSRFNRTVNRNKYQSKVSKETQKPYLNFQVDLKFQGVNRLFVFLFENNELQTSGTRYFVLTVEVKYYNVLISGLFDQPLNNDSKTYDNIGKLKLVKEMITQLFLLLLKKIIT